MTKSPEVEAKIRRLYFAEHWKRGTIAKELGIHNDVVKRVLGLFGPAPGCKAAKSVVLDAHASFVAQTLEQYPSLLATRVYDMLRERGYTGSLRTLRRHVRETRPKPKGEVFLRTDTLPGEQAQVDWAHVGKMRVDGGFRPLWACVVVLAYSRASFAELVFSLDAHSLRRSLLRASTFFGGSPRQWLFDNAKTVVIDRHGDAVRYHPMLVELASRMHVELKLCKPRRPQEKGTVERAIRFFKDRFFPARTFHSLEHGNEQLRHFIEQTAHLRPHPRLSERSVAEVFAEEKERLLALPDPLPSADLVVPIVADKTAFIRFDTNDYSVPSFCARQTLSLVASDTHVRLLHGEKPVAEHARSWGHKQRFELAEHRTELLAHKRAARDLKGRDRLRAELPRSSQLIQMWADHGLHLGSRVAKTIVLLDGYGAPTLALVIDDMLARGVMDPGAMAILCEHIRRKRNDPPKASVTFGRHVPERDVIPHDLGGYDE